MIHIRSLADDQLKFPLDGFKFSIGSAEECDITLAESMLNDIHALLWVGKDFVTVMAVQNAVITLNGDLITDRGVAKIGDKIAFADLEMEVVNITEDSEELVSAEAGQSDWVLISRNQEMKGKRFVIKDSCTIGRAKTNTICIPILSLSRHHATLTVKEDGMHVIDQQSANGTFVNGNQVETILVKKGDIVAFDELEFLVQGPESNIHSEQTSVRNISSPAFAVQRRGPTAIDRQKISIDQHKPESFTQKFKAITEQQQKEASPPWYKQPLVWVGGAIVLALFVLILVLAV